MFRNSGISKENKNEALEVENKESSESERKVLFWLKLPSMRYGVCFLYFPFSSFLEKGYILHLLLEDMKKIFMLWFLLVLLINKPKKLRLNSSKFSCLWLHLLKKTKNKLLQNKLIWLLEYTSFYIFIQGKRYYNHAELDSGFPFEETA